MSSQSWYVDIDGVTRTVVAEHDEVSGRVAVRVDGRMVARPLAAGEEERAFAIGSVTYLLRRLPDGTLDLDLAPPEMQAPPPPQTAATSARSRTAAGTTPLPPERKKRVPLLRIIGSVLVTIVIVSAIRYGRGVVTYMNVPWKSYTHDDRMFRINFAGEPERSVDFIGTPAGVMRTVQLKSKYENHFYIVEFIDMPFEIRIEKEAEVMKAVLEDLVSENRWTLLQSGFAGRNLSYIVQVPQSKEWSEGSMRGNIVTHGKRLYIVYAFVPRGEVLSWDVGEFLRSLELPD